MVRSFSLLNVIPLYVDDFIFIFSCYGHLEGFGFLTLVDSAVKSVTAHTVHIWSHLCSIYLGVESCDTGHADAQI